MRRSNAEKDMRWHASTARPLLASIVLLAAACSGCGDDSRAAASTTSGDQGKPSNGQSLRYRGMAVQITHGPGAYDIYAPLLKEIADLGADTVLLSAAGYMEHARAQAIFVDALRTPSREDFVDLLTKAKEYNLRVILMPIVLLRYPRGSEWRGVIEPPDWDDWWKDYRDFEKYFADIAQDGQADGFILGSELVSTEKYTAEWVKTVEVVRQIFKGKLGYSANWDHYDPVKFWDKLDFIGMTSYYTLADKKNASVDDIVKKWEPIRRNILDWQKKIGKPLILTEVGWCSQEGAATAPWNYYQNQKATPEGLEEQRRLYEAFIKAWDNAPGLGGVIWWEWSSAAGGKDDFNYTPRGKPAEQVLRKWFADKKPSEPAAEPTDGKPGATP